MVPYTRPLRVPGLVLLVRPACLVCLAVLLCLAPVRSLAEEIDTPLAGTNIVLPEIPGFDGHLYKNPGVRAVLDGCTPPSNRLLWGYLSDADSQRIRSGDLMQLDAYILVQAENALAEKRLSPKEFDVFKQGVMDKASGKTVHEIVPMDRILSSISDGFSEKYKTDVNVHVKHSTEISFFDEDRYHVSAINVVSGGAGTNDDIKPFSRVITYNIVLAKNKVLYIYAYRTYRTPADAQASMDLAQRICRQVIRDNPSAETVGAAEAADMVAERHFEHEQTAETIWRVARVVLKYTLLATLAAVLGVAWARFRKRRKGGKRD